MDGRVRRLDIEITIDSAGLQEHVCARLLVDGEDLLGQLTEGIGFDPDDVLGVDSPLLPVVPPRRVALYRCGCGYAGCGAYAAQIAGDERWVEWYDLRDYVGAFDEPLTDLDLEPDAGRRIEAPPIVFDRAQYVAELARADSERNWESEDRRVARLARATFRSRDGELRKLGYRVRHLSPESEGTPAGVFVMVSTASRHLWLSFPPTKAPPEDRAARIVQTILEDAPETWPIDVAETTTDT